MTLLTTKIFGQQLDSLGLGDNSVLNKQEYTFLNADFIEEKPDFDFKEKKIAFICGPRGNYFLTKKEYFDTYIRPRIGTNKKRNYGRIILTQAEKEQSGGYDVLIMTPAKIFTVRDRKRVVTDLAKTK